MMGPLTGVCFNGPCYKFKCFILKGKKANLKTLKVCRAVLATSRASSPHLREKNVIQALVFVGFFLFADRRRCCCCRRRALVKSRMTNNINTRRNFSFSFSHSLGNIYFILYSLHKHTHIHMSIQSTALVHHHANSGCSFCGDTSHIAWSCPKRNRPK